MHVATLSQGRGARARTSRPSSRATAATALLQASRPCPVPLVLRSQFRTASGDGVAASFVLVTLGVAVELPKPRISLPMES